MQVTGRNTHMLNKHVYQMAGVQPSGMHIPAKCVSTDTLRRMMVKRRFLQNRAFFSHSILPTPSSSHFHSNFTSPNFTHIHYMELHCSSVHDRMICPIEDVSEICLLKYH